ncbi:MAG: sodium:solute symporter [Paracoccaceae bacterium]
MQGDGADLAIIDYVIIATYFVVVLAIGFYVSRKIQTGDDLFLAGRGLKWPEIGGSLFASNISSTTLIGLAGAAYMTGISVSNYEWMAGLVLVFMALFYIPVYLRTKITTVPEYLELRFNRTARLYFSAVSIILTLVVDTAGGIYAGGVVMRTFFPGIELWQICVGLAVVAGIYTAAGGLAAVVYTDVIQTVVLIIGSLIITILVFSNFNYSWSEAKASIPDGHLSLIRPIGGEGVPWLGTITGVAFIGFWYWACNQYITQRILGSRSVRDGQWGALLGGALKLLPLFIMVLPGAMAIELFPDLENGDQVFPTLISEVLPIGLTGLVLAGLIAAIMSSIDSTLNSSSTLILNDFVQREDRKISAERMSLYGRICTIVLTALAAAWAPQIANFPGLFNYLQQAFSVAVPPVVVIFLFGMFWRGGAGLTAVLTLAIGHLVGIALFVAAQVYGNQLQQRPGNEAFNWVTDVFLQLHFTIHAGIMVAFSAIVFLVVALFYDGRISKERADKCTWRAGGRGEDYSDLPVWQRPFVLAPVVVAVTAVMILFFW